RTNLRDKPSQGEDSTVIYTLPNGETVQRIGLSDSGWSKVVYKDRVLYAVTNYLTTDLEAKPSPSPENTEDSSVKTKFDTRDEQVTPKDSVNLRKLPSVTDERAEVVATIRKGTVITRTGINEDVGWSRVTYEGQTLYCVSSYIELANQ
ncbi:MAG: SH3 domain-containing protein, partial [Lachnospiraceae bacterium]|nr:SH3 domain-containing protein [Lachnospiraceae bacterium]